MSMTADLVRCSSCDFEQMLTYYTVNCRYHLSDDQVYEYHHRYIGWCRSCQLGRDIESLPDLDVARADPRPCNATDPSSWPRPS